jgi:hypothetical protein
VIPFNQKRSNRYVSVYGRLGVDPDRNHTFEHCCGSGSVSFWASPIRIRHYLCESGSGSIHYKANKIRKTLIHSVL